MPFNSEVKEERQGCILMVSIIVLALESWGGLVLPKRGRPHTALQQHQQNGGRFMHFARLEHIYLPNLGSDQTKLTSSNEGR